MGGGPGGCHTGDCLFKVAVSESTTSPESASSGYDYEARHWIPPKHRALGGALHWTGGNFRCCEEQSTCCAYADIGGRMCDNWEGKNNADGNPCPSGWWACDYRPLSSERRSVGGKS